MATPTPPTNAGVNPSGGGVVQEPWRWPVYISFIVLVAASVGLMLIVGIQSWQQLHTTPNVRISVNDGTPVTREQISEDFKTAFEWYRERVDNLQKLIAVLIGISSFYAVGVAVTSYLNGQTYLKQLALQGNEFLQEMRTKTAEAGEAVKNANVQLNQATQTSNELRSKFNTFGQIRESLLSVMERVDQMLPDVTPILPKYESLDGEIKEEIYFGERSLAFADLLAAGEETGVGNQRISRTFATLERFYRTRFRSEGAKIKFDLSIHRSQWTVQQREIFSLLDRALMYGRMAVARDPKNFPAWTQLGISRQNAELHGLAIEAFNQSLTLRPDQQKARFFMSLSQHGQEQYSQAEATLTDALNRSLWEDREDLDRRQDIFYNRACARSRLASSSTDGAAQLAFAEAAMVDLNSACPRADAYQLTLFVRDCESTGDLAHLAQNYPVQIAIIRERLSGTRPSV
jgi:hypothetical protein